MTLPIAGWYPDPQDPTGTRWWDGTRWGAAAPKPVMQASQTNGPIAPRPPAPSEYRSGTVDAPVRGRNARVERDRATRAANPFGYTGLVLALIAFLFNVFAVPGILGIVFGGMGLARSAQLAGARVTGFGVSLAAVILGLAASGFFLARAAQVLG